MSTIIFYDAGENARAKMNYWREKGLKPVCFVDADVRTHHTLFEGDRDTSFDRSSYKIS